MRAYVVLTAVAAMTCLMACTTTQIVPPLSATEVGELIPGTGILKGYLAPADLPDSLALLPAPPEKGSAASAEDVATFHEMTALQSTPRGQLAKQDADLSYPKAISTFSCALGVPISATSTPNLVMLLRRTLGDAALATSKAKKKYQRTRPFVEFKTSTCAPQDDAMLAKEGSYPSGHSSIGWAWALELAEIAPERADAIFQRGRAFSQSRAICGAHWQSDIESGRLVGAATIARLHANPVFIAQMRAAHDEIVLVRGRADAPLGDCAGETAAIATTSTRAP